MKVNLTSPHFEVFFKKEMKVIKFALNSYKEDKKPEHLHSLRVSIKKIRAVSSIMCYYKPGFNKIIKQLKPLFQEAGIIRSMQINTLLLKEYNLNRSKTYLKTLRNIAEGASFFCNRLELHLKTIKEAESLLQKNSHNIKPKHLNSFLKEEEMILIKLINQKNNDEEHLHDIRKQLKKLLYIHKFLPDQLRILSRLNYQKTAELQEKIGAWHDRVLALFVIEKDFPYRKALIEKLKKETHSEYQSCIQLLKNYL